MFRRSLAVSLLTVSLAGFAPSQSAKVEVEPSVLLISRIKARLKEQFKHVPKYTCLETLDRYHKDAGPRAPERQLDTVRLEVLYSEDKEYFDSPGGHDFKETDPGKFIASGLIGDGLFFSFVKGIFIDDNGIFKYVGEEELEGRPAAHYHFTESTVTGTYTVTVHGARAEVDVSGEFWADPQTYDLIRLQIDPTDIPPILFTKKLLTTVDYAQTRIGEQDVLLPQTGSMYMLRESGEESFDRADFTHCRLYQAESSISFEDPPAEPASPAPAVKKPAPAPPPKRAAPVPAGLKVTIALRTPFNDRTAVGQYIEGNVVGNVTEARRGSIVIPDGAVVRGRIRRLERSSELGGFFDIGLEFTEVVVNGTPLRFFAGLESAAPLEGLAWQMSSASQHDESSPYLKVTRTTVDRFVQPELPGVGSFFMRGAGFTIPAGFRMVWKTQAM
jgi:hypothetical protein